MPPKAVKEDKVGYVIFCDIEVETNVVDLRSEEQEQVFESQAANQHHQAATGYHWKEQGVCK
jgi:hypothetical protein